MILLKVGSPVHLFFYERLPYSPRDHRGLADDLVEVVSRRIWWCSLNRSARTINLRTFRDLNSRSIRLLIFVNAHIAPLAIANKWLNTMMAVGDPAADHVRRGIARSPQNLIEVAKREAF
jgi:hypothetical protein